MWNTKIKAKHYNFSHIWFKNSKILIKNNEDVKIINIKHEDDANLANEKKLHTRQLQLARHELTF